MVAAWMRALTGVGPSIASGSQTWSGNWALLPTAPTNSSRAMTLRTSGSAVSEGPERGRGRSSVPVVQEDADDAQAEAEVADAVDQERLLATRAPARAAVYQKPISR